MKVAASIVTYNPDLGSLKQNLESLLNQVEIVFIIDNASDNINDIKILLNDYCDYDIELVEYKSNKGLAYALNNALSLANDYKCDWIITMDQDSCISKGYTTECQRLIEIINNDKIGIICSEIRDKNVYDSSKLELYNLNEKTFNKEIACITSGSFTNVKAGIACGGFDNSMFIDQIDYDFCFKLINGGFTIFKANNIFILHELGKTVRKNLAGINYLTTNHSPKRLYYIYRNYFILRKNHINLISSNQEVKKWFKKQGLRLAYRPFKILFSEKDKFKKSKSIIVGIFEGLRTTLVK
ncbi:MAG: glycosyltransferase [Dethiosulfatibacter sp.]|nr:glycosyltransferase [Dethiosulfatibacter sp.]